MPLPLAGTGAVPALQFAVESAEPVRFAVAPTIGFALRVESDLPVRSLSLAVQIRIATTRRRYGLAEQDALVELFGEPSRWGTTLRSLLWTNTTLHVPAFDGSTLVELAVPCTYDFDVAAAKYFHGLEDGEAPLEFLFSGTVFYGDGNLLRTARISWESEAEFRLPVSVWKEALELHFPDSAWVRLGRQTFDRLYAYKAQRGLPTWEGALDELLEGKE